MSRHISGGMGGDSITFESHGPLKSALEIKSCEAPGCGRNFTRLVGSVRRDCEPCRVRSESSKRKSDEQMAGIMSEARRRAELVLSGKEMR